MKWLQNIALVFTGVLLLFFVMETFITVFVLNSNDGLTTDLQRKDEILLSNFSVLHARTQQLVEVDMKLMENQTLANTSVTTLITTRTGEDDNYDVLLQNEIATRKMTDMILNDTLLAKINFNAVEREIIDSFLTNDINALAKRINNTDDIVAQNQANITDIASDFPPLFDQDMEFMDRFVNVTALANLLSNETVTLNNTLYEQVMLAMEYAQNATDADAKHVANLAASDTTVTDLSIAQAEFATKITSIQTDSGTATTTNGIMQIKGGSGVTTSFGGSNTISITSQGLDSIDMVVGPIDIVPQGATVLTPTPTPGLIQIDKTDLNTQIGLGDYLTSPTPTPTSAVDVNWVTYQTTGMFEVLDVPAADTFFNENAAVVNTGLGPIPANSRCFMSVEVFAEIEVISGFPEYNALREAQGITADLFVDTDGALTLGDVICKQRIYWRGVDYFSPGPPDAFQLKLRKTFKCTFTPSTPFTPHIGAQVLKGFYNGGYDIKTVFTFATVLLCNEP